MRFMTLNVMSNPLMPQEHVEHDVTKASRLGASVILWQEMSPARYRDAVKALEGDGILSGGFATFFPSEEGKAIPISYRTDVWELVDSGELRAHDGKSETSPPRYCSWVILKHKATGETVVFINAHFVSGAWNGKRKLNKAWRKVQWVIHYRKMRRLIKRFQKRGLTVFGGGDFNRVKVKAFVPDLKWLAYDGIDYLFVVPGETRFKYVFGEKVKNFKSDHNARVASGNLYRSR